MEMTARHAHVSIKQLCAAHGAFHLSAKLKGNVASTQEKTRHSAAEVTVC
jgi:hypothetical protein